MNASTICCSQPASKRNRLPRHQRTNLLEFATDGNPKSGTDEQISAPVDGIIYHIQASADLANWTATPVIEVTPALTTGLPVLNAGWTCRTYRTGTHERAFLRAMIEAAP